MKSALYTVLLMVAATSVEAQFPNGSWTNNFSVGVNNVPFSGSGSVASWMNYNAGDAFIVNDVTTPDPYGGTGAGSLKVTNNFSIANVISRPWGTFSGGAWSESVTCNLSNFDSVSFDVYMGHGQPLSSSGDYGQIGVGFLSTNWAYELFSNVTIPASATNGWVRFTVPINHSLPYESACYNIMFQLTNGAGYPSTTMTNWIGNLILNYTTTNSQSTNQAWNPIDTTQTPISGSALNLSWMNEAPAGKYGFVQISTNGDLYFQNLPGKAVRFFGADLGVSLGSLTQTNSMAIARKMAAMGYNVVRFIGLDNTQWGGIGMWYNPTSTNANAVSLNATAVDQLDYLIFALKQQGVYVQMELTLYFSGSSVPQLSSYTFNGDSNVPLAPLLPFVPGAYGLWQQAAQLWLNHVNPYTGLPIKNDPVLVGLSPWNEDVAINNGTPSITLSNLLITQLNAYCTSNGLPQMTSFPSSFWSSGVSANSLLGFYTQQTLTLYSNIKNFLKNTIQVHAPLTGLNNIPGPAVDYWRSQGPDVFEIHSYYQWLASDPTNWTAGGPYVYSQSTYALSDVFNYTGGNINLCTSYPALSLQQNWGQPFYLTEYDDVLPIPGRDQSGIFAGAVGALQGWDMLTRFEWTEPSTPASDFKVGYVNQFSVQADPLAIMSQYAGSLLFRNGAVSNAPVRFTLVRDISYCKTNSGASYAASGIGNLFYLPYLYNIQNVYANKPGNTYPLIYRDLTYSETTNGIATGSFPSTKKVNITSSQSMSQAAQACISALTGSGVTGEIAIGTMQQTYFNQNKLISETGQLVFDLTAHTFLVNTPTAIAAAGTLNNVTQSFNQAQASLSSVEAKGTVSAFSLDGQALTNSSRILLINTTEAQGFGTTRVTNSTTGNVTYSTPNANATPTVSTPNQVLYTTGNFTFKTSLNPANFRAYRLTMNGQRVGQLPITVAGNQLSINFDTLNGFAFEITTPPVISTSIAGNQLTLSWMGGGTLLQSSNVAGPYAAVNTTTNPYTIKIAPVGTMFFKVSQ